MSGLVVVGSAVFDRVFRVPRLPRPGESVVASSVQGFLGGKGMNQAFAARRAGADTAYVGCVGSDSAGEDFLEALESEGLSRGGVMSVPDTSTGTASVWVDDQGMNAISVFPGANMALRPEWVDEHLAGADYVLAQLEMPVACAAAAAGSAAPLILNPAPFQPVPASLLRQVWMITPNETEAEALTGIFPGDLESCGRCADALHEAGVPHVVLTLGARGAFYSGDSNSWLLAAKQVQAVDSTAAGDVFNGYLAAWLSLGNGIRESVEAAVRAATLSVTRPGALASVPFAHELSLP